MRNAQSPNNAHHIKSHLQCDASLLPRSALAAGNHGDTGHDASSISEAFLGRVRVNFAQNEGGATKEPQLSHKTATNTASRRNEGHEKATTCDPLR